MTRDVEQMSPPTIRGPASASSCPDFKRAFKRFQAHQMTDHAAALTYYSMMSLFPALLAW